MTRWIPLIAAAAALMSCTAQTEGPEQGDRGGACFPNDTCNAGLVCNAGLCESDGVGDMTDTDASDVAGDSPADTPVDGADALDTDADAVGEVTDASDTLDPFVRIEDEFLAGGNGEGIVSTPEGLALEGSNTIGTWVSPVIDAASVVNWQNVEWAPNGSFDRDLPDNGGADTVYGAGNIDMTGNTLLLHFDGTGTQAAGELIPDMSGSGNDAQMNIDGAQYEPGVFTGALHVTDSTFVRVPTAGRGSFDYGTGGFTWSVWVNTRADCTNNTVLLGIEDKENASQTHIWLGGGCWGPCPNNSAVWLLRDDANTGTLVCHPTRINDGGWHHLVGIKRDHSPATLELWVDGEMRSVTHDFGTNTFDTVDDKDFIIGDFTTETYPTDATIDEVAIFDRALTGEEVLSMYRRGLVRASLELKLCDDENCAGEEFVGRNNVSGEWWRDDLHPAMMPVRQDITEVSDSRFIQLRFELTRRNTDINPRVSGIAVEGMRLP